MANPRNKTTLAALDKGLENIETFFVVDYQGLTAGQLSALRKQIREKGGQLIVAKNTLIRRALGEGRDFSDALKGPSALVVAQGDLAAVAKVLSDAAKANDKGIPAMKAGYVEGKRVDLSVVERISSLGTRDQLYAELVGVLGAHQSNFVGILEAYKAKLEETAAA
ncbi:50S ribosomal protein L10 [Deinococcus aquiradiocola]|uniref:Large ribosomal subunit protein uL10 n=1 Tax=Deinococcus aquiradiocola TaxID=393059 RepID=A0A917UPY0_9DEIO|nr:50S ribosomal protein L10 [Deinococcus aquiradiocola]GGJ73790.1 50S ribosomal protein L10 [Deinococcus aquiradiocola]